MFNFAPHRSQFDENYSFEMRGELFAKTHVRTPDKRMRIYADRDAAAGSELFETYGDNQNDIYLHYHAFVPDVNPSACVNVRMDSFDKPRKAKNQRSIEHCLTAKKNISIELAFRVDEKVTVAKTNDVLRSGSTLRSQQNNIEFRTT